MSRTFKEEKNLTCYRYLNNSYLNRKQLNIFVSQLSTIINLNPENVLEIGIGNGFVSTFLKKSGFNVTTFDINSNLNPDITGNIVDLDKFFNNNSFDLILCAEVLEHLPFKYFEQVLRKLNKISCKYVIITLPRMHRVIFDLDLSVKMPWLGFFHIRRFCRLPEKNSVFFKLLKIIFLKTKFFFRIPNRKTKWKNHHWEIDWTPEYSLEIILKKMSSYFDIINSYFDSNVKEHQFFILKTKI